MTDLPHDVITNILALLPLESLQRFKCVSKLWRSTIENQEKLLLVTPQISYSTFNFIHRGKVEEIISPSNPMMLPTKFHTSVPIHISSCHGLVFMALEDGSMILWNPSSRKYDEIPLVDENNSSSSSSSMTRPPMYCFGYDPFSSDYKIVRLKTTMNTGSLETMHEFSRKKRCWRMMNRDILSSKYGLCYINNAVVYDEAFHFLATTLNGNFVTLSYSLKEEKFYEISIPDQELSIYIHGLCLYRHRLSWCTSEVIRQSVKNFEVWSIFGDNWEKVITISKPIGYTYCIPQVKFVRNGGDLMVMNVEEAEPIVYKYNSMWGEFRPTFNYLLPRFAKAVEYVASSVSPTYP